MLHLSSPAEAKKWCASERRQKKTIGFVPTMGALHRGHLSLLDRARQENTACCVSIFINPLQFEDGHDFDAYPRNLNTDLSLLADNGCDMVFQGTLEQFFPEIDHHNSIPLIPAGHFGKGLEEEFRPGHLDGVRTIVDRLFKVVGESKAYFGEKDFQQTLVVSDLARAIGYPKVIVCPTVREASGLALSSRNSLLKAEQENEVIKIYQALLAAKKFWQQGERNPETLCRAMNDILEASTLVMEYAAIRDPENWSASPPYSHLNQAQALIAARMGNVRLIDNMRLDNETP
ncbi:MAG: pantoate--beta-alanine ligase [Proteobacteria bacterium]|jgi:pantoate--beta-alanine ligase|nr:pantoate--beta-alanine ligase [Pseudomonadota bacterium]MDB4825257.1 pantoate--beta-alanine ligase [Gammaproteobacteria bacterium]MBT5189725.1 pantoate--beta-alanine ligase [Pseudomonadota bacterium]MBT6071427.1 pantoate--beta-alanine ligase [Pseudomonadota bacterium]MBT6656848.1 pantoate--beta-alanine ligase [Pseudomonadota bacterium]